MKTFLWSLLRQKIHLPKQIQSVIKSAHSKNIRIAESRENVWVFFAQINPFAIRSFESAISSSNKLQQFLKWISSTKHIRMDRIDFSSGHIQKTNHTLFLWRWCFKCWDFSPHQPGPLLKTVNSYLYLLTHKNLQHHLNIFQFNLCTLASRSTRT